MCIGAMHMPYMRDAHGGQSSGTVLRRMKYAWKAGWLRICAGATWVRGTCRAHETVGMHMGVYMHGWLRICAGATWVRDLPHSHTRWQPLG